MYIHVNAKSRLSKTAALLIAFALLLSLFGCAGKSGGETVSYEYAEVPLERNGIALHLDRICIAGKTDEKNILLVHGLTYSSHEFDIDYKDYSLVRYLAGEGYTVWRVDVAGYGRSGAVEDGFLPDTGYAAGDVCAAAEKIREVTGAETLDLLGWSWGTVIASRFACAHPEYIRKLVLYAPIVTGLGAAEVTEPFHANNWDHAADDFQKTPDGGIDPDITEKELAEMFCGSCWHYDGAQSPNGGRKDLCVDADTVLIAPENIKVPTLMICGDADPYMDPDAVNACRDKLPDGSALVWIEGGGHVMMYEKPVYHAFRERIVTYLSK